MANAIARQVLLNGDRHYTVKITIVGDGSGEETATRINSTTGDMGTNAKIMEVHSNLAGFSARLLFDATTDVVAAQLVADADLHLDFTKQGGLPNNSGAGKTGDILITTSGLGSGDSGHVLLICRKKG